MRPSEEDPAVFQWSNISPNEDSAAWSPLLSFVRPVAILSAATRSVSSPAVLCKRRNAEAQSFVMLYRENLKLWSTPLFFTSRAVALQSSGWDREREVGRAQCRSSDYTHEGKQWVHTACFTCMCTMCFSLLAMVMKWRYQLSLAN